jgi:hypothetical protein
MTASTTNVRSLRVVRERKQVLAEAQDIEPSLAERNRWFASTPIRSLGGRTAREVVEAGETRRLIDLIRFMREAERQR